MPVRLRTGFTLVELIVALMLASAVLGASTAIWVRLVAFEAAVQAEDARQQHSANGERLLRRLAMMVRDERAGGSWFRGSETFVSFDSWCDSSTGVAEACRIRVVLVPSVTSSHRSALHLSTSTADEPMALGVDDVLALRYVTVGAPGGQWTREWASGLSAPAAIAVVRATDTLFLRVGVAQ